MVGENISRIVDFTIPEDMRELTAEEYKQFFRQLKDEENYGMRNEEKHTVLSVSYKKRPLLLGRDATNEANLKATEKRFEKQSPTYKKLGYGQKTADGKTLDYFRFQYEVQGLTQMGEYILYSTSKYFCGFMYICGEDFKDYAEQKMEDLLSTVSFKL